VTGAAPEGTAPLGGGGCHPDSWPQTARMYGVRGALQHLPRPGGWGGPGMGLQLPARRPRARSAVHTAGRERAPSRRGGPACLAEVKHTPSWLWARRPAGPLSCRAPPAACGPFVRPPVSSLLPTASGACRKAGTAARRRAAEPSQRGQRPGAPFRAANPHPHTAVDFGPSHAPRLASQSGQFGPGRLDGAPHTSAPPQGAGRGGGLKYPNDRSSTRDGHPAIRWTHKSLAGASWRGQKAFFL
jgi:hypothetical protein